MIILSLRVVGAPTLSTLSCSFAAPFGRPLGLQRAGARIVSRPTGPSLETAAILDGSRVPRIATHGIKTMTTHVEERSGKNVTGAPEPEERPRISVRGARVHNLKNISFDLPINLM